MDKPLNKKYGIYRNIVTIFMIICILNLIIGLIFTSFCHSVPSEAYTIGQTQATSPGEIAKKATDTAPENLQKLLWNMGFITYYSSPFYHGFFDEHTIQDNPKAILQIIMWSNLLTIALFGTIWYFTRRLLSQGPFFKDNPSFKNQKTLRLISILVLSVALIPSFMESMISNYLNATGLSLLSLRIGGSSLSFLSSGDKSPAIINSWSGLLLVVLGFILWQRSKEFTECSGESKNSNNIIVDKNLKKLQKPCEIIFFIVTVILFVWSYNFINALHTGITTSFMAPERFMVESNTTKDGQNNISIHIYDKTLKSSRSFDLDNTLFTKHIPMNLEKDAKIAYEIELWYQIFTRGLSVFLLYLVWRILHRVTQNITPFQNKTFIELLLIGISLILSILPRMLEISLLKSYFTIQGDGINDFGFLFNILFGLVVLAIAFIFRYGSHLQQESDETI